MSKLGLVIANQHYQDTAWRELPGASEDVKRLHEVLSDPNIGGFDNITVITDGGTLACKREIQSFFAASKKDDILLMHISSHGQKNAQGRLVLASADTERDFIDATGIDSTFINDQMQNSHSNKIVLILDCCYSGAYAKGFNSRGGPVGGSVDIREPLGGRGRFVMTASTSLQFSHEFAIAESREPSQPSVFTLALVEGLKSGEADLDNDGLISIEELYRFVHQRVSETIPNQTPTLSVSSIEGTVYIARSAAGGSLVLPRHLEAATVSSDVFERRKAVRKLAELLSSENQTIRIAAAESLVLLEQDPDRVTAASASAVLGGEVDHTLAAIAKDVQLMGRAFSTGAQSSEARPSGSRSDDALTVGELPGAIESFRRKLDAMVDGREKDPHGILGAHPTRDGRTIIRTFRPEASAATAIVNGLRFPLARLHSAGIFGGLVDAATSDYMVEVTYGESSFVVDDPYRHPPTLDAQDLYLINQGRHERLWERLGSHERDFASASRPIQGVSFAVWAPQAIGVRVIGEFNDWSGKAHPMRSLGTSGVWEVFIPGVHSGILYRYQVLCRDGQWRERSDPLAFATEVPPATASVVTKSHYEWNDEEWLVDRAGGGWHKRPMSIYEVHAGSWLQGLSYRRLADELVDYVVAAGFTHLEFMPLAEHPFGGSWGYQVTAYYAPTARFGTPDDLRYLIDRAHQAGIGVIVDWVPAHFPKDEGALGRFDGTPLYEHGDPRRGELLDSGMFVFDFGRPEVRNFLVANALYWAKEFHVDGLRANAVGSMLYLDYGRQEGQWAPNVHGGRENLEAIAFLQEMNATLYREVPGVITIADGAGGWPGVTRPTHLGGLGFGFQWNTGWTHDTVAYASHAPFDRQHHHEQLTNPMRYAYSENFILPISHDEVVYGQGSLLGRMPGDRWQQLANLRAFLAYMWAHPGKQLLFMGTEFAQDAGWADSRSLDWWQLDDPAHRGVLQLVTDLNSNYRGLEALWSQDVDPGGFQWIDANDASGNVLSFLRYGAPPAPGWAWEGSETRASEKVLACVANFAGIPHRGYRIGLPRGGFWREVLNTDAEGYGGSGVGNSGEVEAIDKPWQAQPFSATVSAPPLGTIWLVHQFEE
jgi:1,4-alpha-glucan branching enzyme